ncbi:MAG: hypothetical protein K6E54_08300 [Bacteroidaceae bacterium]|nr:hypothetical protein [Bacteroidaceae bacterium]
MLQNDIYSSAQLIELIHHVGFLPLLDSGIHGFSAEELVSEDCRYVVFPEGGWDWPLWKWKGDIVSEGDCVYGKFFNKKAGFISKEWWADFYNYRCSKRHEIEDCSIEENILLTLKEHGSLITRDLRAECGFIGNNMRSKFDSYITRMQMECYIVTEDFIYPQDKHGNEYGWGWSLLTTPERLYGKEFCLCSRTPEESFERMLLHLKEFLPKADDKQIYRLIK